MVRFSSAAIAIALLSGCQLTHENGSKVNTVSIADYQRAEQFLPKNVSKLVRNLAVEPQWIDKTSNFWFSEEDKQGNKVYSLYLAKSSTVEPLFDPLFARQHFNLSENELFIPNIEKVDLKNQKVTLSIKGERISCQRNIQSCIKVTDDDNQSELPEYSSPDGKYGLQVKDWNLYLIDNSSKETTQLTFDGTEGYPYAVQNENPKVHINNKGASTTPKLSVYWAPDSKTVVTHRLNRQKVGKLHLIQSVHDEGLRPKLFSYYYPLAGDKHIPEGELVSIDVATKKATKINSPKILQTYYGEPIWGWWESNNRFYFFNDNRGKTQVSFYEYNPSTLQVRLLIQENSEEFLDPWAQSAWVLPESNEVIWASQRSGKQQYYLYDLNTTKLKNQITQCDCYVRVYRALDKENRTLYYEASGAHKDRDPYLRHLYRVNLDGSDHTLLTPEPLEHSTRISPDFTTFVDIASLPQTVPTSKVRSTEDGLLIATVGNPDVTELYATGWQPPETFTVTASDGKTKLYGLLYKPSNFDPNKKYPVIDATYTGPHGFFTPKSFWTYYQQAQSLAELGFIVIKMDGRGTSKRDRAFHLHAYKNLAGGVDDHVQAIKDLSKVRSYLDISRVGIYGFSAGGYDTAQAMFRHADFFKVGVAASGNHDFRTDKTGWNETWLGYPIDKHWDEQTNLNLDSVKKLKGKLMLAHGELDENVNPAATMQLVDKLIKANKDFDLMIYPNADHVLNKNDYFIRQRWDYFVEHLLGAEPVKEYQFTIKQ
ncbi:prolyl oligopeptidase family serine peptidase [Thalassotalea ganghwensis]